MYERIEQLMELLEIELALRGASQPVYEKLFAMSQNIHADDTLEWLEKALELLSDEERRRAESSSPDEA